jgi:O-antigen/teichoic acid export membrane protein
MGFLLVDYFRKNFYLLGKPTMAFAQTLINYSGLFGSVLYFKFTEQLSLETTYTSFGIGYALASVLGLVSYTWSWLNIDQFKQLVREHFNFSGWLTLKAGLTWMATNYYVVEAGKLNTDNFVYGAVIVSSVRVSLGLMGLFSAFYQVLENIIPIAAAKIYVEQGYQGLKNYLIKSTLKNAMIMFPILILIFFGAEWLLEKIYPGEQYHEYAHVLQGFALMNVIIFLGYPIRFALRTMELTRPIFIGYFISGLFSLFTAKWMVTKFEEYGVVAGMLITQVLTLGYYLIVLNLQNRRLSE